MYPATLVKQIFFPFFSEQEQKKNYRHNEINKILDEDRAFHQWYRFVLSFPPHLVQDYVEKFQLKQGSILLDPFCGTGTAIVEAKKKGLRGIGIEANRIAHFASSVKCNWNVKSKALWNDSLRIAETTQQKIQSTRKIRTFSMEQMQMLIGNSMSSLPLHKTLILQEYINERETPFTNYQRLALATATVKYASNLHFGPEVGVSRIKKQDTEVVDDWLSVMKMICDDLETVDNQQFYEAQIYHSDARNIALCLDQKADAVFTSPPYPNEKDYTRTTRLESVLLGFINNKSELREMKQGLLRSNSRNIFKDDSDDRFIKQNSEVTKIAEAIEEKRQKLGKTSGFEKMYHRVVRQYFGGMTRHLESLKPFLKTGAMLGYVVGDQASFLQIPIPTGKILADIAVQIGYELVTIDLFRTRFATATKTNLNEEVVVLRWNGER